MPRLSKNDPNSYSTPETVIIKHIDINWTVDFESKILIGLANYQFHVITGEIDFIILDISDIKIIDISILSEGSEFPINYFVSDNTKLTLELPTKTTGDLNIRIKYETSPDASGLQWLTKEQTAGKRYPYLFSQCQPIHARSVIPCQDSPAIKFTYNVEVNHPTELTALISGVRGKCEPGKTKYEQGVPTPSYLLAIAVGDIVSRDLGPISKVWAEPEIVEAAAYEFADTNKMLRAAISVCGPYVWKQYDLLVMPPSFPYGGMENPCLTFVTPTLLAGDRSLATVVAHEISHSWTGNLVTNKNFEHFWLNEGFTMYVEGKILSLLEGKPARDFQAIEGLGDLEDTLKNDFANKKPLTKLVVDLSDHEPDDAFSVVPYMKGQTFLRYLEDLFGGPETFDPFLKFYIDKFKYQSIETDHFRKTLYDYFKNTHDKELSVVDWDKWLYGEGMPPVIPNYDRTLCDTATEHSTIWANETIDKIRNSKTIGQGLAVSQLIVTLQQLIGKDKINGLSADWIRLLESTYRIDSTKNAEIKYRFYRLCIKARLIDRLPEIIEFANSNFRMKFVKPLYYDMARWPEAKPTAVKNFEDVRKYMMGMCANGIAKDLGV